MGNFVNAMRTKNAYTANGALTNSTSLNKCLDLFSIVGNHKDFKEMFWAAFAEDPNIALKVLFWSRDCRGGSGARMTFVEVFKEMQNTKPELFSSLFRYIPEFGYWKDIYKNLKPTNELLKFVEETLKDENDHSLCAKYFPRKGAWFGAMRKFLNCTPKELRQLIVSKTQVVENYMCANNWKEIDYQGVPSVAGLRYKNSFIKHDGDRYNEYIAKVNTGEAKINSSVLYPHNIYENYLKEVSNRCYLRGNKYNDLSSDVTEPLIAMWNNLPNFMEGCKERLLPICDVSGSMTGTPMNISVSLGCYISERNVGPFKDAFITFSERPQMQYLNGNIIERFRQLERADWGMSTNLQAVFDLILTRAKQANLPEEDMPTKLLIISDMHFNYACPYNDQTNYEVIKQKYESAGYKIPGIIFWNVNGSAGNVPATMFDGNVGLVSGYSPSILQSIFKAEVLTPMELMLKTVDSPRYEMIHI